MAMETVPKLGLVSLVLALSACASSGAIMTDAQAVTDVTQKSAALADRFQADLQWQLQAAMQQGGAVGAVEVCHAVAQSIAATLSEESGAKVRRIALKERNPMARADGDLKAHLDVLAAAPITPDGKPASLQWTSGSGKTAKVNYLRAIPMKEQPCAACHGTSIAPEVQARIAALYPDDRATGFRPGELRGAIAISWSAKQAM